MSFASSHVSKIDGLCGGVDLSEWVRGYVGLLVSSVTVAWLMLP